MVGIWCRPASPCGMLQLPLFNWVYVASGALGVASSLVLILVWESRPPNKETIETMSVRLI